MEGKHTGVAFLEVPYWLGLWVVHVGNGNGNKEDGIRTVFGGDNGMIIDKWHCRAREMCTSTLGAGLMRFVHECLCCLCSEYRTWTLNGQVL
jgi:hypothetical protein